MGIRPPGDKVAGTTDRGVTMTSDDTDLIARIEGLMAEERRLQARESDGNPTYSDRADLVVARLTLDRLYDLLEMRHMDRESELVLA